MSTVGILTFHRAINFGATMQAWALAKTVDSLGYDASIIDYKDNWVEMSSHIWNPFVLTTRKNVLISLKSYFDRFSFLNARKARIQKFKDFWKTDMPFSSNLIYDNYIVGSDQVWNLHITGGFNPFYFLSFNESVGKNKLSYAASGDFDPANLIGKHKADISKFLSYFTAESVREEFLKEEIGNLCDKDISICIDPTLLLDKSKYQAIEKKPQKQNYILVYQMMENPKLNEAADFLSRTTGLDVVYVYGGAYRKNVDNSHISVYGPDEVLGWFDDATYVLTTSFHGVAFSLIYQKQFWFVSTGSGYRQKSLMQSVGLENRVVSGRNDMNLNNIDFDTVNKHLDALRNDSIDFLRKALR
mgnify:CR=1 FL=1